MNYKSAVLISDQHVTKGQDLKRFKALGNLILERKPETVINGGDQLDLQSLYGISSSKASYKFSKQQTKNIQDELDAKDEANKLIFGPTEKFKARQRKNKKKTYEPRRVFCMGNHDLRAQLYWNFNYEEYFALEVGLTLEDWLGFNKYYDEIYDYQAPAEIDGVAFSHNYVNGTSTASTVDGILKITSQSAVGFHSHKAEFKPSYNAMGRPIFGLQGGYFADPDEAAPSWIGPQNATNWWNGIVYLHGLDGTGQFDPEFISTERLLREYL